MVRGKSIHRRDLGCSGDRVRTARHLTQPLNLTRPVPRRQFGSFQALVFCRVKAAQVSGKTLGGALAHDSKVIQMTSRHLILSALLVHVAVGCAPRSASRPTVRLIEYGIIRPVGPFVRHDDPTAAAGFTSSGAGNSVFERRTTEVPAILGIAFGIRYRVENVSPGHTMVVEEIIRHPPITKPDGTVVSEERTKDTLTSDTGFIDRKFFYRLGQPYEVVPGDWSLAVAVNGSKAIDQHFMVRSQK
jgi:uncharacterized protein DUF3859